MTRDLHGREPHAASATLKQSARKHRDRHFAAWEHPDLLAAEMRASFRSLR